MPAATLTHEPDVSPAAWFAGQPGAAAQGPPGFAAYATVRFDEVDRAPYRPDSEVVALATRLAAEHTRTPHRVFFALWDGWGEIDGGSEMLLGVDVRHSSFGRFFTKTPEPSSPPAFSDAVLAAPRVDLGGERSYLLFSGPVDAVGRWDARPLAPGWPRSLPQASLTWPEDHAWFIASDVEESWFTVGGSQTLVDAVLAHPELAAA